MNYTLSDSHENGQNKFELKENSNTAAVVEYTKANDVLTVLHTEVLPEYRGTPAGFSIVEKVKAYAEKNQLNLQSECGYFSHQLDKITST